MLPLIKPQIEYVENWKNEKMSELYGIPKTLDCPVHEIAVTRQ